MSQYPETTSPKEFFKFIKNNDWICIHSKTLAESIKIIKDKSNDWISPAWDEKTSTHFTNVLLPMISESEKQILQDKIRIWWRISEFRIIAAWLVKNLSINIVKNDRDRWKKEIKESREYHLASSSEQIIKMSKYEAFSVNRSSLITNALHSKHSSLSSAYISDVFFAFEALVKSVCSTLCYKFLKDAITPNKIISHPDVYKSLKNLGGNHQDYADCKKCKLYNECPSWIEGSGLSATYVRILHMRVLRDYKEDIFHSHSTELQNYIFNELSEMSFELIFLTEDFLNYNLGEFLKTPMTIREELKELENYRLK